MKICNICKYKYDDVIPHYCRNCGKNLSNQIEKTDVLLFMSNFFKVIGIIGFFLFTCPLMACANVCIDGSCVSDGFSIGTWIIIFLPVLFIIIGYIIKINFKNECLLNINK